MSLKISSGTVTVSGNYDDRFLRYGHHIRPKHGRHGAFPRLIAGAAKSRIEIDAAVLHQDCRIKLRLIAVPFPQTSPVCIVYISIEAVFSCGCITDSH